MRVTETPLAGVLIVEPTVYADARGTFFEAFHAARYAEAGVAGPFVQDNVSRSGRGVLRGLHFQEKHPQGKLVWAVRGRIFDVAVDLRRDSPTYLQHVSVELSEANGRQLWVPPGLAHGFCVLSDAADVCYKCTDVYRPGDEGGLRWDDPALGIEWPVSDPVLSDKDRALPTVDELTAAALPQP
jgi:dTDP-4-dehydrorhamnose 3,5-epimerase